jgi:hypothetical protein
VRIRGRVQIGSRARAVAAWTQDVEPPRTAADPGPARPPVPIPAARRRRAPPGPAPRPQHSFAASVEPEPGKLRQH